MTYLALRLIADIAGEETVTSPSPSVSRVCLVVPARIRDLWMKYFSTKNEKVYLDDTSGVACSGHVADERTAEEGNDVEDLGNVTGNVEDDARDVGNVRDLGDVDEPISGDEATHHKQDTNVADDTDNNVHTDLLSTGDDIVES